MARPTKPSGPAVDDEDPDKSPMDDQRKVTSGGEKQTPVEQNRRQVKQDTELPRKGSA
jgi:hypothetical protein